MIIALLLTATLQASIPGAVAITAIVNSRTASGILSDTGDWVFRGSNRVERFPLMRHGGPVGDEDLFFLFDRDGRPFSQTTSQLAHYQMQEGKSGLRRSFDETRVLAAPDEDTVLSATRLEDGSMRLSVVNLAERGARPNVDYQIRDVGEQVPVGVAARWIDGKPVRYIHFRNRGAPGRIERCSVENGQIIRTVVGSTPLGMSRPVWFEPESGLMVTAVHSPNVIDVATINASTFRTVPEPAQGQGASYPFLWRGDVFLDDSGTKLTYKLNSFGEWDVFCPYDHLASSANGKYWIVRDAVGQSFLVEFGPE